MKRLPAIIITSAILFYACKKEEPEVDPEPVNPVVQKGDLIMKIMTYDSLGEVHSDHSGVKVLLQTGATATTDVSGEVKFSGLAYGAYAPSLLSSGYEGPPVAIDLASATHSVELPLAQHSRYELNNMQCVVYNRDSIALYFKLDKAVPPGKTCKVAVLTFTSSSGGAGSYRSADIISTDTQNVSNFNIARLPNLRNAVETLGGQSFFYVGAVPVSYGVYATNLSVEPVLLGESPKYPGNIQLKKNW